jgi:hypothetical protein
MAKLLIFIIIFLLPSIAMGEPWSTSSKVMYGMSVIALGLDAYSTHEMLNKPNRYETNKILGPHPSDRQLATYAVSCSIIVWGIAYLLPERYRPFFFAPIILVGLNSTRHNFILSTRF